MASYVRYFAESPVTLKALSNALKAIDPELKIDGGDLMRGTDVLAEVAVDSAGSDLFNEEMNARIGALEHLNTQGAQYAMSRLRGAQSIIAIQVEPANWQQLQPLWTVLPTIATGLTQVDGQGYYDGGNLVVGIA